MRPEEPRLLRLRGLAVRALALLAGALLSAVLAPAAWANCGGQTYTYVHNGNGGSYYNLSSGQSLRIQSGVFTNGIGNLPANARICVDSGATFNPSSVNNASGQIFNYGTINFPAVNLNTGFRFDNFANAIFTGSVNFNGAVNFRNRANANLIFRASIQFSNQSVFRNDGSVQADGNLNLQENTQFINTFEVLVKDTFNPSGTVDNTGRIHALRFININAPATAINQCSWIADQGFNNNSPRTQNFGMIYINWNGTGTADLWQNNAEFRMGPNALVYGWRFFNNSLIRNTTAADEAAVGIPAGSGGGKFYFKHPGGTPPAEHTKNQGRFEGESGSNPINFYDETQTGYNANQPASDAWLFDQPYDQNLLNNMGNQPAAAKRAAIASYQRYANAKREAFTPPPIDYAAPTCSPAIRQVMYDPDPPAVTYDYSDAPASYGAPVHRIDPEYHMGDGPPDWDSGPFDTPNADGDDLSGSDDENGIVAMPTFNKGQQVTLDVKVAGAGGYLQGWIDYNGSGTFGDVPGEQIALDVQDNGAGAGISRDHSPAGDGLIRLVFTPPAGAQATKTFIRLRWSPAPGLGPTGPARESAPPGEVEDYTFTFGVAPEPELPPGGGGGAGGGATPSSCSPPQTVTLHTSSGLSWTAGGTVANPGNATGVPALQGTYASAANSANLGVGGFVQLDLTNSSANLIPSYADITLSLTRAGNDARVLVRVSVNGTSWVDIGTYGAGGTLGDDFNNGVLKRVMFEAPAGGIRYVRFEGQAGNFWIDGVSTADICGPLGMPATLTVVKSAEFAPGTFAVPGSDVIYNIVVANTGTMAVDADTVLLVDSLPSEVTFVNSPFAAGQDPVVFSQSGANLAFNYNTDVGFSKQAAAPTSFAQCNQPPGGPLDDTVRHICIRPGGTMAGSSSGTSFTVRFKARIK